MNTHILFAVRCNPSITVKKADQINSKGICYITELLKPESESRPFSKQRNYRELRSFDELKNEAEKNISKDCLIKTASLAGKARFFIEN